MIRLWWHWAQWYLRSRRVQYTLPLSLMILLLLAVAARNQQREVVHIILAALMPALVPTMVLAGVSREFDLIELTFPQPFRRWDSVMVVVAATLGASLAWWLMLSAQESSEYRFRAMIIRAIIFSGMLLFIGAIVSPRFSWVAAVVVLVTTLRPFLQTPQLVEERPEGLLWWPILHETTVELTGIALAVLAGGTWLYVDGERRSRRWFGARRRGPKDARRRTVPSAVTKCSPR